MQTNFTVVDLETTGLDPKKDKIIEIGAIRIIDGEIAEVYDTFVNPGSRLSEKVKELTGIRDEDLASAPYIEDVLPDFLRFHDGDCLLGHRILFDYSFLKRAAVNLGHSFEREGIDTLKIARSCLKDLPSKSLPSLCQHFGIEYRPHRAVEDARATYLLYRKLWELFYEEQGAFFRSQKLIYQVKKESPVTSGQLEQIQRILTYHNLSDIYNRKDSESYLDFTRMTRNEASRFVDQIILNHGRCPQEHLKSEPSSGN